MNKKKLSTIMSSRFSNVRTENPVETLEISAAYQKDTSPSKVDLVSAVYHLDDGERWQLQVVNAAEQSIAYDEALGKEYHSLRNEVGMDAFTFAATKLLLGSENPAIVQGRCFGIQTYASTGAVTLGARFLCKNLGYHTYLCSSPSRSDHELMFNLAGFTVSRSYRYWCKEHHKIDIEKLLEDLNKAPINAVVLLQLVGHKPTGCDLTESQWRQIADVMEKNKLFPFFECRYQGIASGDLDKDSYAVRYFVSRGFELFCAQSFSKNFGLYDERIGNLIVVLNNALLVPQVKSQFCLLIRCLYLHPPLRAARIVAYILNNPQFLQEWKECIKKFAMNIKERRSVLRQALERLQTPGNWEHITRQAGLYSYTGLTSAECNAMVDKHHIYLLPSGCMSFCKITAANVDYVARSIHDVLTRKCVKAEE